MNTLRLSLFKLKKNKKEAAAIVFLTMITVLMLSVFAANISKANKAYDDSFSQAGSKDTCVLINKEKYRDEYKGILEREYGITDITETGSSMLRYSIIKITAVRIVLIVPFSLRKRLNAKWRIS